MPDFLRRYRTLLVLVGLLLGALIFYSISLRQRNEPSAFERRMLDLVSPLQQGMTATGSALKSLRGWFLGGGEVEISRLRSELQTAQRDLVALEEARQETERLRALLDFATQLDSRSVAARVVADDATSWFRTIVIDRGTEDGLKEGFPVMTDQGIVGRVVTCAAGSSRVILAVDAASRVSTLVERTRARGICRGTGEAMSLDYVPMTADVKAGDILVTSGLGGFFPKGLVVGTVTDVTRRGYDMFQTIQVAPAVDFDRLEEVLVIIPEDRPHPPLPNALTRTTSGRL